MRAPRRRIRGLKLVRAEDVERFASQFIAVSSLAARLNTRSEWVARYLARNDILRNVDIDSILERRADGLMVFSSNAGSDLRAKVASYFKGRQEDGGLPVHVSAER